MRVGGIALHVDDADQVDVKASSFDGSPVLHFGRPFEALCTVFLTDEIAAALRCQLDDYLASANRRVAA